MMAPGTVAPTGGAADYCEAWCSQDNAQFSKGLGKSIDEGALREQVPLDWPGNPPAESWQTLKLARDLQCYNHAGDTKSCAPFHPSNPLWFFGPNFPGPYCNNWQFPTLCYFDWDYSNSLSQPQQAVTFDLSRGKFHFGQTCASDTLSDVDEWGRIVALSRANLVHEQKKQYAIYQDVFNGATQPFNYAGWPSQPIESSGLTLSQATYRRNQCLAGMMCPGGGTCLTDACNGPATCKTFGAGCANGKCTCTTDEDCWSSICEAGTCAGLGLGTCSCAQDADCSYLPDQNPPETQCAPQSNGHVACGTRRNAAAMGVSTDERMWESAEFGGSSHLTLGGGWQTPLGTVSTTNEFQLVFDLYWRGFASGESSQVVVDSSFGRLWIAADPDGTNRVRATVYAGSSPVVPSTVSLVPGAWYRVSWSSSVQFAPTRTILAVQARQLSSGWFDGEANSCGYKPSGAADIVAASGLRFGAALSGSQPGLRGRLDNINLFNYSMGTPPSGCEPTMLP